MTILGPPNRGNDPLHVLAMAGGLVAAAVLGASVGYLIDLGTGSDNGGSQPEQQATREGPAD
jgi:hypothetical protein